MYGLLEIKGAANRYKASHLMTLDFPCRAEWPQVEADGWELDPLEIAISKTASGEDILIGQGGFGSVSARLKSPHQKGFGSLSSCSGEILKPHFKLFNKLKPLEGVEVF